MIIWGTRARTRQEGAGQFTCPNCGPGQNYRAMKIQRYFTLYFIPLIPLDVMHRVVQCQTCQKEYRPEVLADNSRNLQAHVNQELSECQRCILAHFARMSGERDTWALARFASLYVSFDGSTLSPGDVLDDLNAPARDDMSLEASQMKRHLDHRGRERVMRMAVLAATVDGALPDDRRQALRGLAEDLDMTDAHFNGVLAGVLSAPE